MSIQIVAEQDVLVGRPTVVEGAAPEGHFAGVFEDDGSAGYFYARDMPATEQSIQESLHVYSVADVTDRATPLTVKVGWSADSMKVLLLINDHPHAVFDFQAKQGFCRTGFPPTAGHDGWSPGGHAWSEAVIELFA